MGQKIVVGPINKGLRNDVLPFNVDNDSFPVLINAYQWRGRVRRKRGSENFSRLRRYFSSSNTSFNPGTTTQNLTLGNGNLLTGFVGSNIEANACIDPGTVSIVGSLATYTDPDQNGTLSPSGTINYATGAIFIAAEAGNNITATFYYFPSLVVLGLEPFVVDSSIQPQELGFDTTYSYQISLSSPYKSYSTSFYWNPATAIYTNYVQKTNWTPVKWNLQNYQQIWTTNYSNALWAIPGIQDPFNNGAGLGMQFKPIVTVTVATPQTATLQITGHGLTVGDFVFVNEVATTTGINFETGYVTTVTDPNNVVVTFPNAVIATNGTGGIAQYLTRSADSTKDCIRWYNADPISGTNPPAFSTVGGWVNFCPPLTSNNVGTFSIGNLPPSGNNTPYYLIGARMVVPFKDRLIFFGVVLQKSTGNPVYLQDTIVFSQNGTPYYTASFDQSTKSPPNPAIVYNPILVPSNQSAQPTSWWENISGFGGFLSAGYARPIVSVSINEDALIIGFSDRQARLIYTSNDIVPFNFYIINSELGTDSSFSTITLDRGVLSLGGRGYILTSQINSQRIDLPIPDEIFEISLLDSGFRRVCAQRDFQQEVVYFTYPSNSSNWVYPTKSLQYNYRDDTWALFTETFTTYGTVRLQTGYTWATVGDEYSSWNAWNVPWEEGQSNSLQPLVIGGNTQGYVLKKGFGTSEGESLYIEDIANSVITSHDHCLKLGDFIQIKGCLGPIGQEVNGKIFQIYDVEQDEFAISPSVQNLSYLGGGQITIFYVPFIQTRQFPVSWEMARKTRIGPQQYLLSETTDSQITLLIYLSQNSSTPYNNLEFPLSPQIVPEPDSLNNALIYSSILYTCNEGTNLGLTPANINLQMLTGSQQQQIWHRMNTSLIGDTIQLGFTISTDQMRLYTDQSASFEITGATQANPCVLTCTGRFPANSLIRIDNVVGMTELNFGRESYNYYLVIDSDATTVTILVDSTGFSAYVEGGTAKEVAFTNPTAELELHSMVIDVTPSGMLA